MVSSASVVNPVLPNDTFLSKGQIKSPQSSITADTLKINMRDPLTIDELIRQRSEEGPNQAIISYPSSGIEYVDYTFRQLDVFASRVAQRYKTIIPQRSSSSDPAIVVGLLGPSNFDYFVSILALAKLGHTVLFLSTRISTAAYTALLRATDTTHILIDQSFREVVDRVRNGFSKLQIQEICNQASYNYPVTVPDQDTRFDRHFQSEVESKKISWIIHSSGSTGLPKPIYQTHHAALNNYSSNLNLKGFITLPLYHAHGLSSVFRAIHSKKQIYMYNATLPLTQRYLLDTMRRYDFQILYGVPYALKILGETREGIVALAKLKVVMFGGSACPDTLGDRLVENGVNLISHYGTTETGQLMTSFRESGDVAWDYVRIPEVYKSLIKFELRDPGIYELIALHGLPSKVASNRPDGSYATKDLFTPHPSIQNAWKYFARLDDTIVLMNGEKVTPIVFEQSVRDNKHVTEAVLFGSGKARVGIMIITSPAAEGLLAGDIKRILDPVFTKANKSVPAYAQLSLDMVRILPIGTEYPRTDKGTVIRAAFYRTFEAQIEETYETAEASSGELCLSEPELRLYIRKELIKFVNSSTASHIEDDTDFFSVGIDSLQAIRLRSVLNKNIYTNGEKLTSNIVFDFPSIGVLARELYRLRTGGASVAFSPTTKMEELIAKYSKFDSHSPVENTKEGQYLVVTGATGSLGAHLVSQLVLRSDVKKVYCLLRANSLISARLRLFRSLRARAIYHDLPLDARRKLFAVPANLGKKSLGLEPELYDAISSEITGLIHCAWSVNFNLGLGSFEADCIAGAHNLINLCLRAQRPEPATFNFCSSVSAVTATKGGLVAEALPECLAYSQNMGYAQSKLVTENICVAASKSYNVKTRVLRIGQIVADTVHGIWNATEAIPLMMQAGLTIGAIPSLDENPLWLPVDIVASTISDISFSNADAGVMNIVNHRSFHWTRDLIPALHRACLKFSELSPKEWVGLLRKSNPDPIKNPPIKLLDFFASKYDNDLPREGLSYDTSYARFLSPSLAAAPVLDQQLVNKFIKQFRASSWITTPRITKRLIVISGPRGAGKSTIAKAVSKEYDIPWIKRDNQHSEKPISRISAGTALSEEDWVAWLASIKATALVQSQAKDGGNNIIVTCPELRRACREDLRQSKGLKTIFIMLQGSQGDIKKRVGEPNVDYMRMKVTESQVPSLESVGKDETDVIPIDVIVSKEGVIAEVLDILKDLTPAC